MGCDPKDYRRLTPDDYRRLCAIRDAGGEAGIKARWEMVERNLGLASHIAKIPRFKRRGVPLADRISVGILGLYRATEDYSLERGRFSTYAVGWIKSHIAKAIEDTPRPARVPRWFWEALARYNAAREAALERGDADDFDAHCAAAGIDGRQRRTFAEGFRTVCRDVLPITHGRVIGRHGDGLAGSGYVAAESLRDPHARTPEAEAIAREETAAVRAAVRRLDPLGREVVRRRYGIGTDPELLREIGDSLGVCRERVRQIQVDAESDLFQFPPLNAHATEAA